MIEYRSEKERKQKESAKFNMEYIMDKERGESSFWSDLLPSMKSPQEVEAGLKYKQFSKMKGASSNFNPNIYETVKSWNQYIPPSLQQVGMGRPEGEKDKRSQTFMTLQKQFEAGKLFDYQTEGYRIPFNEAGKGLNNAAYDKVGSEVGRGVINAPIINAPTSVSNNTITPKRLPSPYAPQVIGEIRGVGGGDKFLS